MKKYLHIISFLIISCSLIGWAGDKKENRKKSKTPKLLTIEKDNNSVYVSAPFIPLNKTSSLYTVTPISTIVQNTRSILGIGRNVWTESDGKILVTYVTGITNSYKLCYAESNSGGTSFDVQSNLGEYYTTDDRYPGLSVGNGYYFISYSEKNQSVGGTGYAGLVLRTADPSSGLWDGNDEILTRGDLSCLISNVGTDESGSKTIAGWWTTNTDDAKKSCYAYSEDGVSFSYQKLFPDSNYDYTSSPGIVISGNYMFACLGSHIIPLLDTMITCHSDTGSSGSGWPVYFESSNSGGNWSSMTPLVGTQLSHYPSQMANYKDNSRLVYYAGSSHWNNESQPLIRNGKIYILSALHSIDYPSDTLTDFTGLFLNQKSASVGGSWSRSMVSTPIVYQNDSTLHGDYSYSEMGTMRDNPNKMYVVAVDRYHNDSYTDTSQIVIFGSTDGGLNWNPNPPIRISPPDLGITTTKDFKFYVSTSPYGYTSGNDFVDIVIIYADDNHSTVYNNTLYHTRVNISSLFINSSPPSAPTGLTATTISSRRIDLAWTGSTTGNPTKYFIYRKDGPAYVLHDSVPALQWSYVDSIKGIDPSTTYLYQVYAVNAFGISGPTNEASATSFAVEPTAQPTNLTITNLNSTSYTLVFNRAQDHPVGYLIIKKADASPTGVPVDGTVYSSGNLIGTDTVAYAGSDTSVDLTGLTPSTVYHFDIFSYNGSGGSINYLTALPLEGSRPTLQTEPPFQPTNFAFSNVHSDSMRVSFNAAVGGPAGYVVLRNTNPVVNIPADGTAYLVGHTIGTDSVVFVGAQTTFGQYGLTPATRYYFKIFSYNGNGPRTNYLTVSPLSGDTITSGTGAAPSPPTNLSAVTYSSGQINLAWTASTGAPIKYRIFRSLTTGMGFELIDSVNHPVTTYSNTGLTAGTRYYYLVYGVNAYGMSPASNETNTWTLASEPTAQPTELSFHAISADTFKVDFKDAAPKPTGYIAIMKIGSPPTTVPVDGTTYTAGTSIGNGKVVYVGTSHVFDQTLAAEDSNYYYTIYSYNGTGNAINYLTSSALAGNYTHIIPPAIVSGSITYLPASPNEGDSIKITVTVNGTSPVAFLTYGNGSHTSAFTVRMNSNSTSFFMTIPHTEVTREGVVYRIKAVNDADSVFYPAAGYASIPIGITDIAAIQDIGSYPDGVVTGNYSTISLPLNTTLDLENYIGPSENGTQWRLVTHAPTEWIDNDTMESNKAYFFFHRETENIQFTPTSAVTNGTGLFENFVLKPEWNLVPWPYAFTANITSRDNLKIGAVHQMIEGSYDSTVVQFKPFGGYVIFNKTGADLPIKDALTWTHTLFSKPLMEKSGYANLNWNIHFKLRNGRSRDLYNIVGVSDNARNEFDVYDDPEPISPGEQTHVYFTAVHSDQSLKKLACDVRASNTEGHVWDMTIERRRNESTADLSWTIAGLPDHYTAKWFDFTANTVIDLLQNQTCKVSGQFIHKGKVIVGTEVFVNREISEIKKIIPDQFALYQNYPNPFNPNTTIKFDVAKTGNVKLQIYNILGQLVTTLVNDNLETGKYDIQWHGKDNHGKTVSSGIYIYRLVTDGYVKSRKMILVR